MARHCLYYSVTYIRGYGVLNFDGHPFQWWISLSFDVSNESSTSLIDEESLWEVSRLSVLGTPCAWLQIGSNGISTEFRLAWGRHDMEALSSLLAVFRGIHRLSEDSPYKWPQMPRLSILFEVGLNILFNKQTSLRWSETSFRPCDVTVMRVNIIMSSKKFNT